MRISIRYADFWRGFQPETILFTRLLRNLYPGGVDVVHDPTRHVDLEIVSVFPFTSPVERAWLLARSATSAEARWEYQQRAARGFRPRYSSKARRRIWYSGENRRVPLGAFDGTLSFDPTDSQTANLYFPHWMLRLQWDSGHDEFEVRPRVAELLRPRAPERRRLTACSFSSQRETHRENVVRAAQGVVPVETFGAAYGRRVDSKMQTMQAYGLQVCTENDLYPNYVTEKLQEAWMGRNVPIWSGLDSDGWFNPDAIIDITHLTPTQVSERLKRVTLDELMDRQSQPLLLREPSLAPLGAFFQRIMDSAPGGR